MSDRVVVGEELVRRHHLAVWRYLRYLGADAGLADDLTQDVFVALLRRPPVDQGASALRAWLRSTARHLFLRSGAAARPGLPIAQADVVEAAWVEFGGDDGGALLDALAACMDGLDDRERRALDLRYRARAPLADIAGALGLEPEGAKTLLRRLRERLQRCVTKRMEG